MLFYAIAREMGVKTAVQHNYEFFDWSDGSIWAKDAPDLFISPSTWHYDEVSSVAEKRGSKHVYLHCPVNRKDIKRRYIDSALLFVHVAGRPAHLDRNGTNTFLEAIKLSNGDLKGSVYTQDSTLENRIKADYPMIAVKHGTERYQDVYKKGSVLVLPRKYGGNCLPMNEALAAGMPVIMSKVSPQNDFLPDRWLVAAHSRDELWYPRPGVAIEVFDVESVDLMFRMRWFVSLSTEDMMAQSDIASNLAETISWEALRSNYEEVLNALAV
jgi:glycosyltransferase involved in cell wall biosynthesis